MNKEKNTETGTEKLKNEKLQKDYVWTFSTYFTEGFPYAIIRSVTPYFLRDSGVALENVGLTSLYGLPWTLKFLWGPWVDEYSTKRRWLISMQMMLFVIFMSAAFFVPLGNSVTVIAVLFLGGSFVAATHDIAIDGYYMEALDKEGQAKYVGYRTMAYRIAWMTGNGVIVTVGISYSWFLAFFSAAILFGIFLLFHIRFLKEVQKPIHKIKALFIRALRLKTLMFSAVLIGVIAGLQIFFKSAAYKYLKVQVPFLAKMRFGHWVAILLLLGLVLVGLFRNKLKALVLKDPDSNYSRAFVKFMDQKKIGLILSFIIFLRLGEWTLSHMVSPFFYDGGVKYHVGWLSAGVGLPLSIIGAVFGGWMISRYSLKKVLWPFILAQNFTNIIYMFLAVHLLPFLQVNPVFKDYNNCAYILNTGWSTLFNYSFPMVEYVSAGSWDLLLVAGTHGFDQFAGGLGTAALMTYLMRICHKDFKAAHYAIGSGLMNLTAPFSGVLSGLIAGWLGFAWLFGLSFVVSIPAMLLIPFLPNLENNGGK